MEQDTEGRLISVINGDKRLLVHKYGHLDGVRAASTRTGTLSPYSLMNFQSVGHDLQKTPGYMAIVEQLDHVVSACFAHPPPETAVPHQCQ